MPLSVLQCTGQAPTTQHYLPNRSVVLKLRSPAPDAGAVAGEVSLVGWGGGSWRRRQDGEHDNRVRGQVGPPLTAFGGLLHTLPTF